MKTFKKYLVTVMCNGTTVVVAIPAHSKKAAAEFLKGNGEVLSVVDVTDKFPIGVDKVGDALAMAQFGQIEMDLVTRALLAVGIAE